MTFIETAEAPSTSFNGLRKGVAGIATYIALYEVFNLVTTVGGEVYAGITEMAGDSEGADKAAEWARRAPLLEELIFGGNPPPDPEDDDGFREMVDRLIRYGGVSVTAICTALGVAPSAISRWRSGKNAPHRYARVSVIQTIIKLMKFED